MLFNKPPHFGNPNRAERRAPATSLESNRSCAGDGNSRDNQTGAASPQTAAAAGAPGRWSRRGQSLTQPALPHAGHGLSPQPCTHHGAISTVVPRQERPLGPGASGLPPQRPGAGTVLTAGTLPPPPQCPLRPPRPPLAPRPPPPRRGLHGPQRGCPGPGGAEGPARVRRPPPPHLRVCG